jgi:hypothetical protein
MFMQSGLPFIAMSARHVTSRAGHVGSFDT